MISSQPIKVIIDTNLWISFLIGKELANLQTLIVSGNVQVILCEQIKAEITAVTQRPKLIKYFSPEKVKELLDILTVIGLLVEIKFQVFICRDEKDNFLLALAQDSQAQFLITGDADLLILKEFKETKIVTYQNFLRQINFS